DAARASLVDVRRPFVEVADHVEDAVAVLALRVVTRGRDRVRRLVDARIVHRLVAAEDVLVRIERSERRLARVVAVARLVLVTVRERRRLLAATRALPLLARA